MNNGISLTEDDIFMSDGDVGGEYLSINIHQSQEEYVKLKQQILNNQAITEKIDEYLKDLETYQPEIRQRAEGILDMRDEVDKKRDREYHLLKFIRNIKYSKCPTENNK